MYNTSYEEYMRTVLGYTTNCKEDTFSNNKCYIDQNNSIMNDFDSEDLFPDIYKKIYPIVCNECSKNNMPITRGNFRADDR